MSTALFIPMRSSSVSFAETVFSAWSRAGFAAAAAALTAGTMLSAFCRPLSSSRTTSWLPATGAQASPEAEPLAAAPPPVPEEPDWPHAAVERTAARAAIGRMVRRRGPVRIDSAFCVPWCPLVGGHACLAGGVPRRTLNPPGRAGGKFVVQHRDLPVTCLRSERDGDLRRLRPAAPEPEPLRPRG